MINYTYDTKRYSNVFDRLLLHERKRRRQRLPLRRRKPNLKRARSRSPKRLRRPQTRRPRRRPRTRSRTRHLCVSTPHSTHLRVESVVRDVLTCRRRETPQFLSLCLPRWLPHGSLRTSPASSTPRASRVRSPSSTPMRSRASSGMSYLGHHLHHYTDD